MQKIKSFFFLLLNHCYEFFRFVKYANCFSTNSPKKLQGKITFNYHSLEKGMINVPLRTRFGQAKINRLKKYLSLWVERGYSLNDTQFLSACTVLKKYQALHQKKNIDISDILTTDVLLFLNQYAGKKEGGTISYKNNDYFTSSDAAFKEFSNSRHSVRHFSNHLIDLKTIEEVIAIARNAPSVCNRQGYKVKFVNNENLVRKILSLQSGLNATSDTVKQLFVVTVDRSIFVSSAEWYQVFIDGGIFLQNLLYSLHYHKIAAVSLNWSKHFVLDKKMERLIKLPPSEKIISIIAAGYPPEEFKVPKSTRKDVKEILEIIE